MAFLVLQEVESYLTKFYNEIKPLPQERQEG